MVTMSREEQILKVYTLLKSVLRRYRRAISLPTNTDPTKTYSWRYLERFMQKIEKLRLEDNLPIIVEAIVEYAHKRGMLHRGIAVLDQKNILDIVLAKLEREGREEEDITKAIEDSEMFVRKQLPVGSKAHFLLAQRPNRTAYSNITRWYKANQISIGYIAVSRECKKALGTLSHDELELFPQPVDLLRMRLQLISNHSIVERLKTTLGNDLVED